MYIIILFVGIISQFIVSGRKTYGCCDTARNFPEATTVNIILEMAGGAGGGFLHLLLGRLFVAGFALQIFM